MLDSLDEFKVGHIYREGNELVDKLAKEAAMKGQTESWMMLGKISCLQHGQIWKQSIIMAIFGISHSPLSHDYTCVLVMNSN